MPVYLYQCDRCENTTEMVNSVAERHTNAPICGKNATHGRMGIRLTAPLVHVAQDCHYVCPVTRQKVTSHRQRRRIMDENRLVDANDFKPEQGFAKAEKEKARDQELIRQLHKDLTTDQRRPFKDSELHGLFPQLETSP